LSASAWLRKNVAIPLWVAKDRSPRLSYLRALEESQFWTIEALQALQLQKIVAMLEHAYRETTYYRQAIDAAGFRPGDIRTLADFSRKMPLLTKEQIRISHQDLLAGSLRSGHLSEFTTGGSTGKPVTVLKDPRTVELSNASALRAFRWAGWDMGQPWGLIWGNPPTKSTLKEKALDVLIDPEIYLDTMNLNDESMHAFVRRWRLRRPTIMRGHSHSIFIFASFCARHAITDLRPRAIISSSMMLLPTERRVIEAAFGCKVTDLYGCEEVGLIASECDKHAGLHVDMENVYVEILDEQGNVAPPGVNGAIVVTSLIADAMPIIRYRMGDMASFAQRACACGRGLQLLNGVSGRVADFLVRADGSVVAGVSLVERTLTRFPGIAQMQLIQEDMRSIVVKLVRAEDYTDETEKGLIAELKDSVGDHNMVSIEFISQIPQEKSGKYRFAISKVPNPYGT
jgi:phenylacetate-CoA ligase